MVRTQTLQHFMRACKYGLCPRANTRVRAPVARCVCKARACVCTCSNSGLLPSGDRWGERGRGTEGGGEGEGEWEGEGEGAGEGEAKYARRGGGIRQGITPCYWTGLVR